MTESTFLSKLLQVTKPKVQELQVQKVIVAKKQELEKLEKLEELEKLELELVDWWKYFSGSK